MNISMKTILTKKRVCYAYGQSVGCMRSFIILCAPRIHFILKASSSHGKKRLNLDNCIAVLIPSYITIDQNG